MALRFNTIDVFTEQRFGGNPLAVVLDAEGLSDPQMQAIAAEFNLAETTFVYPPKDPANTAEVRIFTPRAEMPFAGHPNVGTAFALARIGESYGRPVSGESLVFEEKAGLVRMDILKTGSEISGARLASPQTLTVGEGFPAETVAAACGLSVEDIEDGSHRPCVASCGAPFLFAEVRSRAALARAAHRTEVFEQNLPIDQVTGIHLYLREPGEGAEIQARMFAPLHGVPEDPATGSANVALVGLLAQLAPDADLNLTLKISQGVDMGRPSLMTAGARKTGGKVTDTWIGGSCVPVMKGEIELG